MKLSMQNLFLSKDNEKRALAPIFMEHQKLLKKIELQTLYNNEPVLAKIGHSRSEATSLR
jgi:hypothetical protein